MDFADEITRGAEFFEAGKYAEAAEVFRGQCEKSDLARTGKIIAAHNLATTYDKLGHTDHAIQTHEFSVATATEDYEFAQSHRAEYLHKLGRNDEAIAVWNDLLRLEFIPPDHAEAYRKNISTSQVAK